MYCLSIVSVLFSGLPFNCDSHCVTRRHQASPGTVGENEPWKRFHCCLSPVQLWVCSSNISNTSDGVSSGYPNTEKSSKYDGQRRS